MGGRLTLLLAVVTAATFATIGALSARQISDSSFAIPALEAGVAATVDIDRYLVDELPGLREGLATSGDEVMALPGFPVEVLVTKADLAKDEPELRESVLSRAAARVYDGGSRTFDRTGRQSLGLFSSEFELALLVDRLNAGTHRLAGWTALIAAVAWGLAAALVIARERRLPSTLGAAVLVGSAPGIALAALAWLGAGQFGSGGDPYSEEMRSILRAAASVPLRNFLTAAVAGGLVTSSVLIINLFANLGPAPPRSARGESGSRR